MGKGGSATTKVEIPDELKPVFSTLGTQWSGAMQAHPMNGPESWFKQGQDQWDYSNPALGSQADWKYPQSLQQQGPLDTYLTNPKYTEYELPPMAQPVHVRRAQAGRPAAKNATASTAATQGMATAQGASTAPASSGGTPTSKAGATQAPPTSKGDLAGNGGGGTVGPNASTFGLPTASTYASRAEFKRSKQAG